MNGPRAFSAEESAVVLERLCALSAAKRAVVKASRAASDRKGTADCKATLATKRADFKSRIRTVLNLGPSLEAEEILRAGSTLISNLDFTSSGTRQDPVAENGFRGSAHERIRNLTKGHTGEVEISITTIRRTHLFYLLPTTVSLAGDVQALLWKLFMYGDEAANPQGNGTQSPAPKTKRNESQALHHEAGQVPGMVNTHDGTGHRTAGPFRAGASTAGGPGVGVAALNESPFPSPPPAGSAAGNIQPDTSSAAPQHQALRRVPLKKRAKCLAGKGKGSTSALGGGAVNTPGLMAPGIGASHRWPRAGTTGGGVGVASGATLDAPGARVAVSASSRSGKMMFSQAAKGAGGDGSGSSSSATGAMKVQEPIANLTRPDSSNEGGDGIISGGAREALPGRSVVAGTADAVDKDPPASSNGETTTGEAGAASTAARTTVTAATTTDTAAATTDTAAAASANAGASVAGVLVEGSHHPQELEIGQEVEYRWGPLGKWYRCAVTKVFGDAATKGVEVEFLTRKRKKNAGRTFSEILEVSKLRADGDLAVPGTHIDWD